MFCLSPDDDVMAWIGASSDGSDGGFCPICELGRCSYTMVKPLSYTQGNQSDNVVEKY